MRKETLLGVGFLIAAIAEIQWATAFLGRQDDRVESFLTFAAGAGCLLAAFGYFLMDEATWPRILGLSVAALAHVGYFGVTLPWDMDNPPSSYALGAASLLAAVGLAVAASGAMGKGKPQQMRVGLAGAALAGLLWTTYDLVNGDATFMVGNVFATIGFAMAAWYAGVA